VSTYLAIDWDHNRLHLAAATVSGRGDVRLDKVLAWDEPDLTLANAEEAGQRLSKRLKEARIAAAPVLACLGRERVIVKEIRYPIVGLAEEPAIIRFQASKELTEPAETVVIDYAALDGVGSDGERRALLLVARRPQLAMYKKVCQAAGLKLVGLTPRPFGIAACLKRATPKPQRGLAVAVLTVTNSWAEFAVVGGSQLLFARSAPVGGNMIAEVRRNLTLYAGQPVHSSRDAVQMLYVAGGADQPLLRELQDTLAIPVHALDPLAGSEHIEYAGDRAGLTGAVGLLLAWGGHNELPVNFVAPKEPRPIVDTNRQRLVLAGAGGILCFIALFFIGMLLENAKSAELDQARLELEQAETVLKNLQPEAKQIAALNDWHKTAVPLIDEIYDLTKRFPYSRGFHLDQLTIAPVPQLNAKETHAVRLTMSGNVPKTDVHLVQQLIDTVNRDKRCRAALVSLRASDSGEADGKAERFVIRVDVAGSAPAAASPKRPAVGGKS